MNNLLDTITTRYIIILAVTLFGIGAVGVLARRNIIVIFMSVEIMLNSANLLFITFSRMYADVSGQIMVLFVMAVAAAEAAIGLALVIVLYRNFKTLDITKVSELKG